MKKEGKKVGAMASWKFWLVVWGMGIAGQLCWNMENQWFNTFVYVKIGQHVDIVNWMVILSAFVTTISTFVFGTMADRQGKRKKFVSIGYIIWGVATILFGTTEFIVKDHKTASAVAVAGVLVVLTDAVMSFFGSMGYDSGFNVWLNDHTDDSNKGQVGAALAALPIFGTIVGTLLGGALVDAGNPTAGTDAYDPSLGNYQLLFWAMGLFVIVMGVISLFMMKDHPTLVPHKQGTFFAQLTEAFNFKKLKNNPDNKEMLLANLVVCAFFIPFNFYFVHMGNWIIYDIGFTSGDMGLIQGIPLLFAVLVTIPFIKLINKDKIPLVTLIAVLANALGLILIGLFVKDSTCVDTSSVFALRNIPILGCVFLVGMGYVLITQAGMIWVRGLFPEENKGQFEGIRVLFFVLIPMLIGTLIGGAIIKDTAQSGTPNLDDFGMPVEVPQENLFLIGGLVVLITLIPLVFATKLYNKRIAQKKAAQAIVDAVNNTTAE